MDKVELRLAIEVDGPTHQGSEAQAHDQVRQQFIESLDIKFLRFTNSEVYQNLDAVVEIIYQKVLGLKKGH
jgi:very-short-patch-repair endonuclease